MMGFNVRTVFTASLLLALALLPLILEGQPFYIGVLSRAMILSIAALSLNLILG